MSHNPFCVGGQVANGRVICLQLSTGVSVFPGTFLFVAPPNCSNRRNRQRNIQFYRIPKEKAARQKWLQRIRRKGFQPAENTRLCSEHFLGGKRSMDPASASYLPSVFDHSHNKSVKTRVTRASRNAGSQVDHEPKMKRKPSWVSPLNACTLEA